MFNLEKTERGIIIALSITAVLGMAVIGYKKIHTPADIKIGHFEEPLREKRRIDINTADSGDLTQLPGIGDALAGRIIDYRSSEGPFASIEDIKKVRGIGDALFNRIKDRISAE